MNIYPKIRNIIKKYFTKKQKSETSKCRERLSKYCQGDGMDIGYGGDPILPNSICMDLPDPYAKYESHPQHLHGDAQSLYWFSDNCLDYVYSSHVLEDFVDTGKVLREWVRILKPGGHLVLFLPDEQTYRKFCYSRGKKPNSHHIHDNFSIEYLKNSISEHSLPLRVIHESFPVERYSFELVLTKV